MSISRSRAARLGNETLEILRAGHYTPPGGERIEIGKDVRRAIEGTISYPPDSTLPRYECRNLDTRFAVSNTTTLAAARNLAAEGHRVAALNFASAKHPGGGFLNGARAQEESLCRASALYACLRGSPMYGFHAGTTGGWYTNYAIYSPDVPVIRDDEGELLAAPYLCSFITAPAVNAGAVRDRTPQAIRKEMTRRVDKVLSLAAGHGHAVLILGAWGCGVFRNEPEMIAELFHEALSASFRGMFATVEFAVLDSSADEHFIGPFEQRFGSQRTSST